MRDPFAERFERVFLLCAIRKGCLNVKSVFENAAYIWSGCHDLCKDAFESARNQREDVLCQS